MSHVAPTHELITASPTELLQACSILREGWSSATRKAYHEERRAVHLETELRRLVTERDLEHQRMHILLHEAEERVHLYERSFHMKTPNRRSENNSDYPVSDTDTENQLRAEIVRLERLLRIRDRRAPDEVCQRHEIDLLHRAHAEDTVTIMEQSAELAEFRVVCEALKKCQEFVPNAEQSLGRGTARGTDGKSAPTMVSRSSQSDDSILCSHRVIVKLHAEKSALQKQNTMYSTEVARLDALNGRLQALIEGGSTGVSSSD